MGVLSLAFELRTCSSDLFALLRKAAPAINYLGKRGGFLQYIGEVRQQDLDSTFTTPALQESGSSRGHRTALDDFGLKATFQALSSFSSTEIRRDVERRFVETHVPLKVHNTGPGFVEYRADSKVK